MRISESKLKKYMEVGYKGDIDFVTKYHTVRGSMSFCIKEEIKMVVSQGKFDSLKYYAVYDGSCPIGHTIVGKNYLFSFCININHRTKEIVLGWLSKVKELLNNEFGVFLSKNNERAIRFFVRNGFVVHNDSGNVVTLIYT